jgi:hypothetical protein
LTKRPSILEDLQGCPALAVFYLIGSCVFIVIHEDVRVDLDFFNGRIDLFPECHFVKFVLDNLV